jgi:hypothetical protein
VLDLTLAFLAAIRVFFRGRVQTSGSPGAAAAAGCAETQTAATGIELLGPPVLDKRRRVCPRWSDVLLIVKPETVVGWHRAGFRRYWRWRSQPRRGQPRISDEIRSLIHRIAAENSDWGAPKIHGELLKLGFSVSERTIARHLRRLQRRGDPGKRWLAFLANRREVIVAFDFFTVPTLTFKMLYCFS